MKVRLMEPSCLCGQTIGRTDRHEDMTKLIVDFYNFVKAHKIYMQNKKEITNYECDVVLNDRIDKTPVASLIFI
jgi:hypothetical protein